MKDTFRKLLLLCSDLDERYSLHMPFVDGDYIYATDGRIIARSTREGMGGIPVGSERLPRNPELVFPDRPDASFTRSRSLKFPDSEWFPHVINGREVIKPDVVHPCKIGNCILSPKYVNVLCSEFPGFEIEVNSPDRTVMFRTDDLEGAVIGMRCENGPYWVWDLVDGGYLKVYSHPTDRDGFTTEPPAA